MAYRDIKRIYNIALSGKEIRSSLIGKLGAYSLIRIEFRGEDGEWRTITTIKPQFKKESEAIDKVLWNE